MSFIRFEMISGAAGSAWFLWNAAVATHQATADGADKAEALAEALCILGVSPLAKRRETMFVHNGLSAVRPRVG